ncbi:sensor histidine kinase [Rufibacter roseus]|uniref:Sensor histidine kinase n=1 Tax=Rufibacter roseus TaxID=1567108 RepID=A0ABW2DN22_9BACT|nr:histidine kinase [Rufibacter roseus]
MKELLFKHSVQTRVEFWAATTIYVFTVFFLVTGAHSPFEGDFIREKVLFHYYENFVFPRFIQYTFLYAAFLFLTLKVVPNLVQREGLVKNSIFLLLAFLLIGLVYGITNTYLKRYLFMMYDTEDQTYNAIFQSSYSYAFRLLLMLVFYTFVKLASLYILSNSEAIQTKYRMVTRDALLAFVLWMVSMFLLMVVDAEEGEFLVIWGVVGLMAIIIYCLSFYSLIPKSLVQKRPFLRYMLRVLFVLAIAFLPIFFLAFMLIHDEDSALALAFFNIPFQLLITVPVCWALYKRQLQGKEEVFVLQKELGRSNASFDFLRSQINPHFLFNTLNTLYGTALQENSERTAQGIQMLGDMMRFMLHENHQQKILLSREIEYMRNYIDLQQLRTSTTPNIDIQTKIEDVLAEKFIAPMLLIPFVENAFKHGISLKSKSWIKVSLHYEPNKLLFDVYNSTHVKNEQDPEKEKSGVGLENVKQRLNMLYANKHELIIRETQEEFFVHLTIEL